MRKIAIVDICGTIFNSNTTFDFLRLNFPRFDSLCKSKPLTLANKITTRFFNIDFIRWVGIRNLKGMAKGDLRQKAKDFYDGYLTARKNDEVMNLIADLRTQDFSIILISGTLDFIADEIAERIDADGVYSTLLAYNGNLCSGFIKADLLGNKHRTLEQIKHETDDEILVYTITDNKSDAKLVNTSNFKCIVSSPKNLPYWKKNIKNEFRLIKV